MLRTELQLRKEVSTIRKIQIEREQRWDAFVAAEHPLIEALEQIPGLDISFSVVSLNLIAVGDGKLLAAIFRTLRTHGWQLDPLSPRPQAKTAEWTGGFDKGKLRVRISFVSSVCRMQQVGTKMVERPVYEVVCETGEESNAEVAASLD